MHLDKLHHRGARRGLRVLFSSSIVATIVLNAVYLGCAAAVATSTSPLALAVGFFTGVAVADLLTGTVHWVCDTWGDDDSAIIHAFREHHHAPQTILDHDWVEVNGEAAIAAALGLLVLSPLVWHLVRSGSGFGCAFLWSFVTFAAGANQLHKWAHQPEPPGPVRSLQRWGLILSPERHHQHHLQPHSDNYCISSGWLNRPLDAIGFWRQLESLIERSTGAKARAFQEGR